MDGTLSNYANAFFALALESNKLENYHEDALTIQKVFTKEKDLLKVLTCYLLDESERMKIIDKVFSSLLEEDSRNFIKVILSNHKLKNINEIIDMFHDLYNEKNNICKGTVYSSIPLSKEQIIRIEVAFYDKKKQKVELVNKIDKEIIGGVKVVIKDHIYDGSIKNQLELLKLDLKKEG